MLTRLAKGLNDDSRPLLQATSALLLLLLPYGRRARSRIVPGLASALRPGNRIRQETAATLLYRTGVAGAPALPALLDAMADEPGDVRESAALAISSLWVGLEIEHRFAGHLPPADMILGTLLWCLGRVEERAVRRAALQVAFSIGPEAVPLADAIVRCADDADESVRRAAVLALARLRPVPDGAIRALARLLDDPTPGVRRLAAVALRGHASESRSAVEPVIEGLIDKQNHPDPAVRQKARSALTELSPWTLVPLLRAIATARLTGEQGGFLLAVALAFADHISPEQLQGIARAAAEALDGHLTFSFSGAELEAVVGKARAKAVFDALQMYRLRPTR